MIIGASLVFHEEEDLLRLPSVAGLNLQLAFFNHLPLNFFIRHNCIEKIKAAGIKVVSVHSPNIDFSLGPVAIMNILKKSVNLIDGSIKEKLVTLHPLKAPKYPKPTEDKLYEVEALCENEDIKICWEVFPSSKKKWWRTPFDFKNLIETHTGFGFTFDTSHLEDPYWLHKLTWDYICPYVNIIHLSARPLTPIPGAVDLSTGQTKYIKEHCPIFGIKPIYDYQTFLNIIKMSGWDGQIILEYMPQYDGKLIKHVNQLKSQFKL